MAKSKKTNGGTLGPVTILGGGNVGRALARGWVEKGRFKAGEISIRGMEQVIALMGEGGTIAAPLPKAERFVDLRALQAAGIQ